MGAGGGLRRLLMEWSVEKEVGKREDQVVYHTHTLCAVCEGEPGCVVV